MSQLYPTNESGFGAVFDGRPFIRGTTKQTDDAGMLAFGAVFDGRPFITNTQQVSAPATNSEFITLLLYWAGV